jgi:hypothetical protein
LALAGLLAMTERMIRVQVEKLEPYNLDVVEGLSRFMKSGGVLGRSPKVLVLYMINIIWYNPKCGGSNGGTPLGFIWTPLYKFQQNVLKERVIDEGH